VVVVLRRLRLAGTIAVANDYCRAASRQHYGITRYPACNQPTKYKRIASSERNDAVP
jgi:hypothetical protein